ncbi:hypothetical protein RD792_001186 [Penstemon davidsonii]|uniref:Histidine decarboxylase n=1 Tax=Penstemon davidsonii TaxID=160366 RepID=A0ABR0DNE6_9LAMI|nr:hypothetical protein RD792_001186 [Penstemon davidsonii]
MVSMNSKEMESSDVVEPCDEECFEDRMDYLIKIVTQFHEHLKERASHYLGYPANQNCNDYVALSSLLKFHINNIGDPFKESGNGVHSKKFEIGVLDWFARLWNIEKDAYWGYVTSGGTEGSLHGLLLGRELLPLGILYSSKDSHYSIPKIARMYRMDFETIASLESGEMDCNDLKSKLIINKDRPAIINVNIGTTFKGAVDNLDLVLQTLEDCGFSHDQFYIHCDAAIYGIIAPLLDQGHIYTFKKPIGSVSISGHKFLGSPMPCGIQMTRKSYRNILSNKVEYIDTIDNTISGSRNGHAPIFLWYGLNMKGCKGLQKDVENCIKNAQYLRDRLKHAGISTMLNEMSITVVFERPLDHEIVHKWQLQCVGNMAHIIVMPHVEREMLDDFLDDLLQKRINWYLDGKIQPHCLAEDIGVANCACSIHGK